MLCCVFLVIGDVCWVWIIMFGLILSVYEVCGFGIGCSELLGFGVVILMRYCW